jgi:hypothetical protein
MSAQTEAVALVSQGSTIRRAVIAALALAFAFPAAFVAQSSAPSDFSSSQPVISSMDNPQQSSTLPPAPTPQDTTQPSEHQDKQTTRILGILPNFRAVSSSEHLPAQSVKEKFVTASEDSFDYSALPIPLAVAGYNDLRNSTPEFGTGGIGYARYLWHSVVDQTSENYFVEFIVPAAAHEDTRFYTLGHGGFLKRSGYALSRVVVTRSDAGNPTFNLGEVLGAGMAAGLSNAYYPAATRSFSNTGSQWGLDIAIDAASFVVKEFWPDINHFLFHGDKTFNSPASPASTH